MKSRSKECETVREQNGQEILKKIEKAAKEKCKGIPSIYLVVEEGVDSKEFTDSYENILRENGMYPIRGNATELRLVFPRNGTENLYKQFFSSPRLISFVQNKYYGVFEISFEEWHGKELLNDQEFMNLLTFIDDNRENIYFVFKVENRYLNKDELKKVLNNHINLEEVHLKSNNIEKAAVYVRSILEERGYQFPSDAEEALRKIVEERMKVNSSAYMGDQFLKQIANNIHYELCVEKDYPEEIVFVTCEMLKEIEDKIFIPSDVSTNVKMGF